jgi:U3 small nucleolar RNA-associated protein 14
MSFTIQSIGNNNDLFIIVSGGIHTLSSRGNSEKRHDSQEKLTEYQSPMASSSRGTGSEDNDSDFDNQSHEDDIDNDEEQINEQEEQQKQIIVPKKKIIFFFYLNFYLDETTKNSLGY